jgi:hypothetical protein
MIKNFHFSMLSTPALGVLRGEIHVQQSTPLAGWRLKENVLGGACSTNREATIVIFHSENLKGRSQLLVASTNPQELYET